MPTNIIVKLTDSDIPSEPAMETAPSDAGSYGAHSLEELGGTVPKIEMARVVPARTEVLEDVDATLGHDGRRWYVFRANVRQEALAEANLDAQGFEHFLPKVLVTRRHARRLITKREWLFPRYGFVALDLTRDRWRSVNGTMGVERLVMGKDGPQAVPHGIIEALSACVDDRGLFDPNTGLKPGDTVRVTVGVFAGALGELQSLDAKGRIELLLHWLNGTVRVKLARDWVEAAA